MYDVIERFNSSFLHDWLSIYFGMSGFVTWLALFVNLLNVHLLKSLFRPVCQTGLRSDFKSCDPDIGYKNGFSLQVTNRYPEGFG